MGSTSRKSLYTDAYTKLTLLLREKRRHDKVTQEELAAKIGWTQTDISKAERGERRLDVVEFLKISKALKADHHSIIDSVLKEIED